jgi:hypothetical protein
MTGYTYDDLDRLHTITYPVDGAHPQGRLVTYVLDPVGNRIRETEKDSADVVLADKQGVFDNVNRLTDRFYCLSKMHAGHAVVCWAQEYEELGEAQPYDVTYPSWSTWFLQHVASPQQGAVNG